MTHSILLWVVVTVAAIAVYLTGIGVGKRYERRRLTFDFQAILVRILHFAAKQEYKMMHLFLQDLIVDKNILEEIRREESDGQDALEQVRARMERSSLPVIPPE
jgi:hypothetical protein